MTPPQGGFAFEEETMRTMINKWLTLADQYDGSAQAIDMTSATPEQLAPGLDFASRTQAAAALSSIEAYRTYLKKNRELCIAQAQLLQATLDDYLGQEHQRVRDLTDSGQAGI